MQTPSDARADGYVECDDCGHPIEEHGRTGCEALLAAYGGCPCPVSFTEQEIGDIRERYGLPRYFEAI